MVRGPPLLYFCAVREHGGTYGGFNMGSYAKKLEEAASRQLRNAWAVMAHACFLMGTSRCICAERREAESVAGPL